MRILADSDLKNCKKMFSFYGWKFAVLQFRTLIPFIVTFVTDGNPLFVIGWGDDVWATNGKRAKVS
jgi:hypothetical protein